MAEQHAEVPILVKVRNFSRREAGFLEMEGEEQQRRVGIVLYDRGRQGLGLGYVVNSRDGKRSSRDPCSWNCGQRGTDAVQRLMAFAIGFAAGLGRDSWFAGEMERVVGPV